VKLVSTFSIVLSAATISVAGFATLPVHAKTVGLVPSSNSLGRAEAVTAGAYGTDALFYNPAGLAFNRIQIRLIGIEQTAGFDEPAFNKSMSGIEQPVTIEDYFKIMGDQSEVFGSVTARAIDISVPFFGISSFVRGQVSGIADESGASHHYEMMTDAGVVGGLALKYRKVALGYSQFALVRAGLNSHPTTEHMMTIHEAVSADALNEETVPFRDFTDFYYGGARGHNVGLMYYWWEENLSGVGISVLNVGGVDFKEKAPLNRNDVEKAETKFLDSVRAYDLDLELPDGLPQVVNVGANIGFGGGYDSVFDARIGLDMHDVTGNHIKHKFAASYDLGLHIPDKLALLFSVPIINTNWIMQAMGEKPTGDGHLIHVGLLGLRAFGGYRAESHVVRGAGVSLHFGVERMVSVLKLDLEWFRTDPLEDSDHVPEVGGRALLGLTLIF